VSINRIGWLSGNSYGQILSSTQDKTGSKDFTRIMNNQLKNKEQEKLYKSCQELESVFLNKVLDSMRATVVSGGLFAKSFAQDTFESMLYEEYAKKMSQAGSLGIADIIYKQLSQQLQGPNEGNATDSTPASDNSPEAI